DATSRGKWNSSQQFHISFPRRHRYVSERRCPPVFDWLIVRLVFLLVLSLSSYYMQPFGLQKWTAAVAGIALGLAILLFEIRLNKAVLTRLIGAAVGSILGIVGAYLISLVLSLALPAVPRNNISFVQIVVLLLMWYIGLVVGASKGDMLNLAALGGIF